MNALLQLLHELGADEMATTPIENGKLVYYTIQHRGAAYADLGTNGFALFISTDAETAQETIYRLFKHTGRYDDHQMKAYARVVKDHIVIPCPIVENEWAITGIDEMPVYQATNGWGFSGFYTPEEAANWLACYTDLKTAEISPINEHIVLTAAGGETVSFEVNNKLARPNILAALQKLCK
jgi:hypothetical protein